MSYSIGRHPSVSKKRKFQYSLIPSKLKIIIIKKVLCLYLRVIGECIIKTNVGNK